MEAYKIIYAAAGLPVPEKDPLEWSTCTEHDEPNRYTIQVMVIDEHGFNIIKVFVANHCKGSWSIDVTGEFELSLKTQTTHTVNFKDTVVNKLIDNFMTVPFNDKLRILHQIIDATKVRATTHAKVIQALKDTYPKLNDVTDYSYSELLYSNDLLKNKKQYIDGLLFNISDKNVYGSLSNSLQLTDDGFELNTYSKANHSKSTIYFSMDNHYNVDMGTMSVLLGGSYVINDLGFKLNFS